MYCKNCGAEIDDKAVICIKCGCSTSSQNPIPNPGVSEKSGLATLLLCLLLGGLGAHRFYVGKIGTGILQLLTCGGCGIWALIDLIMICTGSFTDEFGKPVKIWYFIESSFSSSFYFQSRCTLSRQSSSLPKITCRYVCSGSCSIKNAGDVLQQDQYSRCSISDSRRLTPTTN